MKFFKKVLIAFLSIGLLTVPSHKNVETVEAATPTILYLKPGTNWKKDGARFAAYFFGNGETWSPMDKCPRDSDYYKVTVPTAKVYPNVIFCRMNPSTTANNWNNKWNQTGDLKIPTDGKNLFTVSNSSWDGATTTWSSWSETPDPEIEKLAQAKENGKNEVVNYATSKKNSNNYSENGIKKIDDIVSIAKNEIDAAPDTPSVTTIVSNAKTNIDKVRTVEEEATKKTNTFYYYDSEGWGNVSAYIWSDVENNELFPESATSWPGIKLDKVPEKNNWYSITCSYYDSINIIFNDGVNGSNNQTVDIVGLTSDSYFYGKEGKVFESYNAVESNFSKFFNESEQLYLIPNSEWVKDNAWFAAYFFSTFSSAYTWTKLIDEDNNGIFETNVPSGEWNRMIFVRMDANKQDLSWGSKKNQTVDIEPNEVTKNTYIINGGSNDDFTGSWNIYPENDYMTHGDVLLLKAKQWSTKPNRPVTVYLFGNQHSEWVKLDLIPGTSYYKFTVPNYGNYHSMIFAEHKQGTEDFDFNTTVQDMNNRTRDIAYDSNYNIIELDDNFWAATEDKWNDSLYSRRNTRVDGGYYLPSEPKAQLSMSYTYSGLNVNSVNRVGIRLGSGPINKTTIFGGFTPDKYYVDLTINGKTITREWTNETVGHVTADGRELSEGETSDYIQWSIALDNVKDKFAQLQYTVSFSTVGSTEKHVIGTRTTSVYEIAQKYLDSGLVDGLNYDACEQIAAANTASTFEEVKALLAKNAPTIKLTNDIVVDELFIDNKTVTIDLNGHSIRATKAPVHHTTDNGEAYTSLYAIYAKNNSVVNIIGEGEVYGGTGADDNTAVRASGNSVVNIYGGTYNVGIDGAEDEGKGRGENTLYVTDASTINIYGGTFASEATYDGIYFILNPQENSEAKFNVYGGTFIGYNPASNYTGENFVAEGYKVVKETVNGINHYTVVEA